MATNTTFDENTGINKLANVLIQRMKKEGENPLCLDFGEIQANGSLITNTFPVSIPKGQYCVCRQLTLGTAGDGLTKTEDDGSHQHNEDNSGDDLHKENEGTHQHTVLIPEKMRSLQAGDRVLVAWVQNEAVVIDIITNS